PQPSASRPSPSSAACRLPGRHWRSPDISSRCRRIARLSPTAPDPTRVPAPVWRNSSDSRGGRPGRSAVDWRRGALPNTRWNQSTPATLRGLRKSAPTVTKKSGHTSPERLVVQLVDNRDVNGDVHLSGLDGCAAATAMAACRAPFSWVVLSPVDAVQLDVIAHRFLRGDDHGADVGDVVDLDVDRVPGTVADHGVLLVLIDGNAGRLNVGIQDPLTLDGFQQGGHLGVGGIHRVGRRR